MIIFPLSSLFYSTTFSYYQTFLSNCEYICFSDLYCTGLLLCFRTCFKPMHTYKVYYMFSYCFPISQTISCLFANYSYLIVQHLIFFPFSFYCIPMFFGHVLHQFISDNCHKIDLIKINAK